MEQRRRKIRLTPRTLNAVLGCWLAISAVAWPHSGTQRASTLLSGATIVLLEVAGRKNQWAHRTTGLIATWVVLSLFVLWPRPRTAWNNLGAGLLIASLSVIEADRVFLRRRQYRASPP
ncbi:MAG TPA: hypothetical protein VMU50_05125 [Polyangia bacterium]|nr:hypothetical protein [Polyangia bacterium]